MRVLRHVQIGGNDCESALHVVHNISPPRIDIANKNTPTTVSAGIGGLPPETQNEDLIQERLL